MTAAEPLSTRVARMDDAQRVRLRRLLSGIGTVANEIRERSDEAMFFLSLGREINIDTLPADCERLAELVAQLKEI